MDKSVKIKGKEKFFYGLGDLSANILLAAASFYLLFFMVSIGGLKPALASLVFLISKIWDAITDVWMDGSATIQNPDSGRDGSI